MGQANLFAYLKKYLEEGVEFNLINGELPAGGEKSIPLSPSKMMVIGLLLLLGSFLKNN